jgi:hypothetical protein
MEAVRGRSGRAGAGNVLAERQQCPYQQGDQNEWGTFQVTLLVLFLASPAVRLARQPL